MFHKLLTVCILLPLTLSLCHNYLQGDTYFNESTVNSSYCAPIIRWPISDTTISQYQAFDTTAQSLYEILYTRYKSNPQQIDIDCLGIARYMFCAYAYPTCVPADGFGVRSDDTADKKNVCEWMCNLWMVRCPGQFDLYETMCRDKRPDICSYAQNVIMLVGVTLISLLMVL